MIPRLIILAVLILVAHLLAACTATTSALRDYQSHVAARQDTMAGYSKDGGYGAEWTHKVYYR